MGGLITSKLGEPKSTPKLGLSKLPFKSRESSTPIPTPPLHPPFSIPFRWEEAPGKPKEKPSSRSTEFKTKVARCLDLPPGMISDDDVKITIAPSPIAVADEIYVDRSLSLACTFSFRKGPIMCRDDVLRLKRKSSAARNISGSSGMRGKSIKVDGKFDGRGSFDFSAPSIGDGCRSDEKNVKSKRNKRKRNYFSFSPLNSSLLAAICASFKQAMLWRCR